MSERIDVMSAMSPIKPAIDSTSDIETESAFAAGPLGDGDDAVIRATLFGEEREAVARPGECVFGLASNGTGGGVGLGHAARHVFRGLLRLAHRAREP
jgi:hypothetical protein